MRKRISNHLANYTSFYIFLVVALFSIFAIINIMDFNINNNSITGAVTYDSVQCQFSWYQQVIIDGEYYPCTSSTPYCYAPGRSEGIAKCCNWNEVSGYTDCVDIGPENEPECDMECPDGYECESDGICRNNYETCTESGDSGQDYYTIGTVIDTETSWTGNQWTDSCNDDQELIEFYCTSDNVALVYYTCPHGCQDGICLSEPTAAVPEDETEIEAEGAEEETEEIEQVCSPEELTCSSGYTSVEKCKSDGSGWETEEVCDYICEDAICYTYDEYYEIDEPDPIDEDGETEYEEEESEPLDIEEPDPIDEDPIPDYDEQESEEIDIDYEENLDLDEETEYKEEKSESLDIEEPDPIDEDPIANYDEQESTGIEIEEFEKEESNEIEEETEEPLWQDYGICSGTPTSCTKYALSECDSHPGCVNFDFWFFKICIGTPDDCSTYTNKDKNKCEEQGCTWS